MKFEPRNARFFIYEKVQKLENSWLTFADRHGLTGKTAWGAMSASGESRELSETEVRQLNENSLKNRTAREASKNALKP